MKLTLRRYSWILMFQFALLGVDLFFNAFGPSLARNRLQTAIFFFVWLLPFAQATSASMFQFLERPDAEGDQSWSHLLPTNFYSEMNQQYYRRFRRHGSELRGQRRRHQFEYAQYI